MAFQEKIGEEKTTIEAETLAAKIIARLEDNVDKDANEKETKMDANIESANEMLARLTSEVKKIIVSQRNVNFIK